jgi:hypothetical protein
MTTVTRLRAELAAQLVETGHASEVWLALPGVVLHLASLGIEPANILEAVATKRLPVRYFGPGPVPRQPNPALCGINAAELLGWLLEQDAPEETLH